ncbi:glycosyltransferase family 2 protein [Pelagibacterales bacterium SAG-MED13]|nr:glycosyltransferase family 2 protein [Pelagibacterales bacterium SAG-MED13]
MKKLFIKLAKFLGFEIIDQNKFLSPTIGRELNDDLSVFNNKSIVLPLGEVKITRKVTSILIIIRMNTDVEIWDQNKKRLFEKSKIEYSIKSINSMIKSINFCQIKYPNLKIQSVIIDDNSKKQNLDKIKEVIMNNNIEIISLDHKKYEKIIKRQKTNQTYSNLASLLQSFEFGKKYAEDLVFFVEDDYLHFETMLEEMISSFERIASQLGKDIFLCPSDYPYLYMNNEKTNVLLGSRRHWRSINKTLCTFLTTKNLINQYWDNFYNNCLDRHDPFEKYLNEIYEKELCLSPIKSLSLHLTNVNSSYGLAPFIDYKKLWNES